MRLFLVKQGIPLRAQAPLIANLLGMTEGQVRRKLRDDSAWLPAQIECIADNFGANVNDILVHNSKHETQTIIPFGHSTDAILHMFGNVPCHIVIGTQLTNTTRTTPLIAREDNYIWHVFISESINQREQYKFYCVNEIKVNFQNTAKIDKPTIAIIDDRDADSTARLLKDHGFIAHAYSDQDSFINDSKTKKYDAIVLDWVLDSEHADKLINEILSVSIDTVPILLFTGFAMDFEVELKNVLKKYSNVGFLEKPASPWVIEEKLRELINKVH